MNLLEIAFSAFLDAAESVLGERVKVTLRGEQVDAFIYRQTEDYGPGAGGVSDNSPISFCISKASVVLPLLELGQSDSPDTVVVRGKTLYVLTHQPLEGRIEITAGTATSQME